MKIILTQKQAQVYRLWKSGLTQRKIAQQLGCTATNICQVLTRIERKYPELNLKLYSQRKVVLDTEQLNNSGT